MQLMMLPLLLYTITALSSLEGCGSLQVPVVIKDESVYYLKGTTQLPPSDDDPTYATMMHFLTSGKTPVTRYQWNAISKGKACMDLSAFADFNVEIAKLCSQVPCSYKLQAILPRLVARLKRESLY